MEIRSDFRDRLEASCRTIPTGAMHLLLKALLPKDRPPMTREPKPQIPGDDNGLPPPPAIRGVGTGAVSTRAPKRSIRKNSARYRVLKVNAHRAHNSATNRYWRAKFATAAEFINDDDSPMWAADAQRRLDEHFGLGEVEIGLPWLIRAGYIEVL